MFQAGDKDCFIYIYIILHSASSPTCFCVHILALIACGSTFLPNFRYLLEYSKIYRNRVSADKITLVPERISRAGIWHRKRALFAGMSAHNFIFHALLILPAFIYDSRRLKRLATNNRLRQAGTEGWTQRSGAFLRTFFSSLAIMVPHNRRIIFFNSI